MINLEQKYIKSIEVLLNIIGVNIDKDLNSSNLFFGTSNEHINNKLLFSKYLNINNNILINNLSQENKDNMLINDINSITTINIIRNTIKDVLDKPLSLEIIIGPNIKEVSSDITLRQNDLLTNLVNKYKELILNNLNIEVNIIIKRVSI